MTKITDMKRGQVYQAGGDIAVILDVFKSTQTDNYILKVHFTRNIGRGVDMLEITPILNKGIGDWVLVDANELAKRITTRQQWIRQESEALLGIVGEAFNRDVDFGSLA